MDQQPHPDLGPLTSLLGTWRGEGRGEYPTIEPFGYLEEVTFGHSGKPFLIYAQRTRASDDGRPLHVETGYWRAPTPERCELVLAHPTGLTELAEGTIVGDDRVRDGRVRDDRGGLTIDVTSTTVGLSASAKEVVGVERTFVLHTADDPSEDELRYTLRMAAVGQPMHHHLAASLRRSIEP